jgi:hypothetical protein
VAQSVPWSAPARIEAEVQRLQAEIRSAGERAAVLAPTQGAVDGGAGYREAVGEVAAATRALIEYEAAIPGLQEGYVQHVSVLITRWSGGLLALVGVVGGIAAGFGALAFWWLFPAIALAAAGLANLAGAQQRAADPALRPRIGAASFAVAGIVAALCVGRVLPLVTLLLAFAACWIGLCAFRLLGSSRPAKAADRRGRG